MPQNQKMKQFSFLYGSTRLCLIPLDPQCQSSNSSIYQIKGEDTFVIPTSQLFLSFRQSKEMVPFLNQHQLHLEERISETDCIVRTTSNAIDWTSRYQTSPELTIAEPILYASTTQFSFQMPTDELLKTQWYLDNQGIDHLNGRHWAFRKRADAKVIEAWKILSKATGEMGSTDITIAVIDKGFDIHHPDFSGKVVAPKDFFNPEQAQFRFQVSPDHTGQLTTNADHGTACAGIALALANGKGIVGVAPNAKFMPIQYNSASALDLRRMLRYIMENNGDVISCSFGTKGLPMDSLTAKVIHDCATKGRNGKGCVICFATGNDAEMLHNNELATHPDVIAVGASTSEDTFAPYTNRTVNMSIVAPGGYGFSGMMTTTDVGFDIHGKPVGKGDSDTPFYRMDAAGTSFACPLVAGVAALILSANPALTAKEVKQILEETADQIGHPNDYDQNGHSVMFGFGRVNAANAVRKALGHPLKRYTRAAKPNIDIAPFQLNLGTVVNDRLQAFEEEVSFRYTVPDRHRGNTLVVELETPIGHNPNKILALFAQKGRLSTLSEFQSQALLNDDLRARMVIQDLSPGPYFITIRCLDNRTFQWIKGGGAFELTFKIEQAIADDPVDGLGVFAGLDDGTLDRLS